VDLSSLCAAVREAPTIVPVGARTHWDVGGIPAHGVEVRAPVGVVRHDPADLTVTVAAGTSVAELGAVLAENGQECPLDPRDGAATVGGVLSVGLSGHRRLRYGPVRDRVLEVRVVTADGRVVKGGGPTVKNVSGYDLPRLIVGSLGTLGVLARVTLRVQPLPASSVWTTTDAPPEDVRRALFRPSSLLWDGRRCAVLLEGHPADVEAELRAARLAPLDAAPDWPDGAHRGRVSIAPARVRSLAAELDGCGVRWVGELGVGTVHIAADEVAALAAARDVAAGHGGWLLREAGAPELDPFGVPAANLALTRRVKAAFDPGDRCNPGRIPGLGAEPRPRQEVDVEGSRAG
jgi:glycolate dehydrogenase FAD-binding subunit